MPGLTHGWSSFNHSNPAMRKAWVNTLTKAFTTGLIDGVFIDITPQALANQPDANYSANVNELCPFPQCSKQRQADLLDGLRLLFSELHDALPKALVICNPIDAVQYPACNVAFFECFGCQTNSQWKPIGGDHGRDVTEDMRLLGSKWRDSHHLVQARAPGTHNKTLGIHLAEFLLYVSNYTYFGESHSPGWGCGDGWLDELPEYSYPLGLPLGEAVNRSNVYTREFSSGTKVWLNLTHPPVSLKQSRACIWWGNGKITSWPPGFDCRQ